MHTRAASRLLEASNDTSTHQNGEHLLSPSQGGEGKHDRESRPRSRVGVLFDLFSLIRQGIPRT